MALITFGSEVTSSSPGISFEPTKIGNVSENNTPSNVPSNTIAPVYPSLKPVQPIAQPPKSIPKELPPKPIKIPYPICGTVWGDSNNNGIKDKEDIVLKDIEVELYTADNFAIPVGIALTDSKGNYEFKNIKLNYYYVKVNLPNNYKLLNKGEYSAINSKTLFSDKLYNDKENLNVLIGLNKGFKIGGIAFYDYNNSSIYQKNCIGVKEISLHLYDKNNNLIASTTTSEFMLLDGYFEFNNLPLGEYKISFSPPKGLGVSLPIYNYYYGSKANQRDNSVVINIVNKNIENIFIGFFGHM